MRQKQWTEPRLWRKLKPAARGMRKDSTPAEAELWSLLRGGKVERARFRRQHAIGRFIVDFFCVEHQLAIEVDGPVHEARAVEDAAREAYLKELGIRVLRFSNDEVLNASGAVLARIRAAMKHR